MGDIGLPELLVIAVLVILLFGANRLPEVGKGLGEAIRSFKKGLHGDDRREADGSNQERREIV